MPSTFKLGFSGGTGSATDYHDIRNLKVVKPVDLSITKTGPASATVGDTITYKVVATNNGPNSAPGSTITGTASAAGELANSANLTTPTDLSSTGTTSVTNTAAMVAC